MVRHDAEPEDPPVLAVKTPDFGGEETGVTRDLKDVTPLRGARC